MRAFAITVLVVAAIVGWAAGGGHWPSLVPSPAQHLAAAPAAPHQTFSPTVSTPSPAANSEATSGSVTIPRGWQGHFMTDGDVSGTRLHFVVDTGATTVALGREDAQSAGLNLAALDFNHEGQTAGGTTRYAPVVLASVRIGGIELHDVNAVVLDVPQTMPLLGQSFLNRLDKVSIEGDRMTLTKL